MRWVLRVWTDNLLALSDYGSGELYATAGQFAHIGTKDIELVAKDLAGYRLVFYTNADVRRFTSCGIINDNFVIEWDRSKLHHSDANAMSAGELFTADNLLVRMNVSGQRSGIRTLQRSIV